MNSHITDSIEPIDRKTLRSICDAGERLRENLRPITSDLPDHLQGLMDELRSHDDHDRYDADQALNKPAAVFGFVPVKSPHAFNHRYLGPIAGRLLIEDELSATAPVGAWLRRVAQCRQINAASCDPRRTADRNRHHRSRHAGVSAACAGSPDGPEVRFEVVLKADLEREALLREAEPAHDPTRIVDIQTRLADIDAHSAPACAASILSKRWPRIFHR